MPSTLEIPPAIPVPATTSNPRREPLRLKTPEEADAYLAKHLKPVRFGPKGQPIYALKDIQNLNVIFPEDL